MKNRVFSIALLAFFAAVFCAPVRSEDGQQQPVTKKYLVILADWGDRGPTADVVKTFFQYPGLRLTVAWPAGKKPSPETAALAHAGRIEPALTLLDEPVLPLLYETSISSPVPVRFSWPGDVIDVIARSQEGFPAFFPGVRGGLYLRSGAFSETLIPAFRRMGIPWVVLPENELLKSGAWIKDGFPVLAAANPAFASAENMVQEVLRSSAPVVVLGPYHLSAAQVMELGRVLAAAPQITVVTPSRLAGDDLKHLLAPAERVSTDLSPWLRRPAVWMQLAQARQAIEEYKNSGQATVRQLELVRGEIFHLYRYDLLLKLQDSASMENEQRFEAGIANIYRLLNREAPAMPAEVPAAPAAVSAADRTLSASPLPGGFRFSVSNSSGVPFSVREFSVRADSDSIRYAVNVGTAVPSEPFFVDIYMDLNNQPGAGMARFLPGPEGFMRQEDAWEFALRIERYQASLYRAGRFEPVLVKTFMVGKRYEAVIPRAYLRGNPLNWGYQAVTLLRRDDAWQIMDFMALDETQRREAAALRPMQLPAIRAKSLLP